jgi:hypothetical protein
MDLTGDITMMIRIDIYICIEPLLGAKSSFRLFLTITSLNLYRRKLFVLLLSSSVDEEMKAQSASRKLPKVR